MDTQKEKMPCDICGEEKVNKSDYAKNRKKCADCAREEATINLLSNGGKTGIKRIEDCPRFRRTGQPCEVACFECTRAHSIKQTKKFVGDSIVGA